MSYLVYGLADPRTNEVFYVGKACRYSVALRHLRQAHQAGDTNRIKVSPFKAVASMFMLGVCRSEASAARLEASLIKRWSRCGVKLTNLIGGRI